MKKTVTKRLLCGFLSLVLLLSLMPVTGVLAAKEMFQISRAQITGLDAPAAGKTPDYTATVSSSVSTNMAYDGTTTKNGIRWEQYDEEFSYVKDMKPTDTFVGGYYYFCFICLKPTEPNVSFTTPFTATINGKTANISGRVENKTVTIYTSFWVDKATVSKVELTVPRPLAGKTPSFPKQNTDAYESRNTDPKLSNQSNGIVWNNGNVNITVNNLFDANKKYSVSFTLFPKDGYAFASTVTATVNGQSAKVTKGNGYITVTLSNLVPALSTIPSVAITGIDAPMAGKKPDYTCTLGSGDYKLTAKNDDYYQNGIAWAEFPEGSSSGRVMRKDEVFKAGGRYGVFIYLDSAKAGYGFDGSAATLNGTKVTLASDGASARVIRTFDPCIVDLNNISVAVTAPVAGSKPDFTKITGTGYYSDNAGNAPNAYKNGIGWFKSASSAIAPGSIETFEAGKTYTVKIILTAEKGYRFTASTKATINGKTASVERVNDTVAILELSIAVPKAPHTHTPSGWKQDATNHWKICTDSACGSIVTAAEAHKDGNKDGKCDTCGYAMPVEKPATPPVTIPTEPKPTEPKPTEPKPTEPKPTEPKPTEPKPTEPVVEPSDEPTAAPTDEPTVEPTDEPTEPKPTEPESTEPKPTEPQTADPKPSMNWLWIVLAIIAAAALGAGVVLIIMKKKK